MTGDAVAIVDTGGANLASLEIALARLDTRAVVTSEPQRIRAAERVVLPGVGSAANAMQRLRTAGLVEVLRSLTQPVLGICLGMQLLFEHSAEGETQCLGLLPGRVVRLQAAPGQPVPHMGWNRLLPRRRDALLEGLGLGDHVYFVHSYAAPVGPCTLAAAEYGGELSALVRMRNFCGTQFHPERSAAAGARLLRNFLALPP